MPANLENSDEATGLAKVTFHFNPKKAMSQSDSFNYIQTTAQLYSSHMLAK